MEWFTLARVGLLYDIAGAFIFVVGYIAAGRVAYLEANLFYRDEPETKKIIAAKWDSWVGLALLVLGFVGQLIGSDTRLSAWFDQSETWRTASLIALLGVTAGYLAIRPRLIQTHYERRRPNSEAPG